MGLRANLPSVYLKDMYKVHFQTKKAAQVRWSEIYSVVTGVKGAGDKETQILNLGDLERHTVEGQDINFASPAEGWPFYVKYHTFSKGLKLSFEAKEDNTKLGDLMKRLASTWTKSSIDARETLGAGIFNNGGTLSGHWSFDGTHQGQTDPSGYLMYDSVPFFALSGNEYTKKDGTTYYNSVASLDLDVDNFATIYNLHVATNAYDENGRPVTDPVDTLLTRRGADLQMAKRIQWTSKGIPGSTINDKNIWEDTAKPIDWAYLTPSVDAFYVGKRGSEDMQFHIRMMGTFDYFEDKNNRGVKASFMERFGILLKGRPWTRGGGNSAA